MPPASSRERPPISACVITRDEEDRIGECLASVAWCDEILVVDSHSTDRTREIAAAAGARVIERDWPGHVAQKEFAIREARHDWVLCLDADERVTKALAEEIESRRGTGLERAAGYRMPRLSKYLGAWIRHGSWYPDRKLRLFDRRRGAWGGRDPHDRVELDGPVVDLESDLEHHPYRDLEDHLRTIDRYSTTMAEQLHADGRRGRLIDVWLRPPLRFLSFYWLRGGVLDGWRGLLLAILAAHYVRLRYLKLWSLSQ